MNRSRKAPARFLGGTGAFHTLYLQLQYYITVSLSKYLERVIAGDWCFPSYRKECGICQGADCAEPHGFYWRTAITLSKTLPIPVVRYLCNKTGRTFSLLPIPVTPYKRYCGESTYQVVSRLRTMSLKQIQDYFAESLPHLCISTIYRMRRLLYTGFELLKMLRYLRNNGRNWLDSLADYVEAFPGKLIGLMNEFEQTEKRFLLGIPSQLR